MNAQQALDYRQVTLPILTREYEITRKMLEAIPADKCTYRQDEICKSAFDLAWHIAATDNMFLDAVASGQFNLDRNKRPESVKTPADILNWYSESWKQTFDRVAQLSGDDLAKIVDFRGLLKQPAVLFLELGLRHTVHHRGQLTMYLRPMGAKIPSIYGESYDATQARLAAQQQSTTA